MEVYFCLFQIFEIPDRPIIIYRSTKEMDFILIILIDFGIIWIGLAELSNPRMHTNVLVGEAQVLPIT